MKAYYSFKHLIPWKLRLAMRRKLAGYRRVKYAAEWPIDKKAGATPPGWPGWPDRKQFALVLTHDVEGAKGLSRVPQLMELEIKYGFRSSFNFVPEGEYRVSDQTRETLTRAGFEVGIHGLEHDGKLYWSRANFASKVERIKDYAREWNVRGFRSPFMQHRLPWLHELGLEYDLSTFDTDPFEPEPDGVATIFPFWVPGPNDSGFTELPYTLPQDFTLYVVLREQTNEIWKRKLDWIAQSGGMALLNTHPDYMCFDKNEQARDEYPVARYEDFLKYLREKYDGLFWAATPLEVARYYCESVPRLDRNSRKKICMVTHSNYETDNRVRRYAESLARRGDLVDVIALGGNLTSLGHEEICGVNVFRIQNRDRNERSKWTYAWRLTRFLLTSSIILTRRHHRIRYDVIHVHNLPDFLVFSAWYPRLTGAKLILDIHDIVPELFASKFKAREDSAYVGLLKQMEKVSTEFVDHVIISNHLWYEKLTSRSVPKEKCSVFINYVDPVIFYRRPRTRDDGKFIILFPGSLHWHQGLDIAIEAFALIKNEIPNAEFHIYGSGNMEVELKELVQRLGLNEKVLFFGGTPLERIADVIANADVGVVPKRSDSFGDEAYSTKIMEFMSQGVPVIVSRTTIDTFYFDERVVRFFKSGDVQDLARAITEIAGDELLCKSLVSAGYDYATQNGWDTRKKEYLDLVDSLSTEVFTTAGPDVRAGVKPDPVGVA